MLADHPLEPLPSVAAEDGPELERPEAAAERRPVLAEAVDRVRRPQILGHEAERVAQHVRPAAPDERAVDRHEHPLVCVDDERVGAVDALERPAQLGADHGRARVGGVDMEPDARLARRRRRSRARGRPRRSMSSRRSRRRRMRRRGRARPGGGGRRRRPALSAARGRASSPPSRPTSARARSNDDRPIGRELACRREADERRRRGRVLDMSVPTGREAEQVGYPVEDDALQLGRRRRRAPEDRVLVDRRCEQLREDRGLGARDREVAEEPRRLPVGHRREQDLVEIAENGRERLATIGCASGQLRAHPAGLDLGEHRQLVDVL